MNAPVLGKLKASCNRVPNPMVNEHLASYLIRKLSPFCMLWSSFVHNRETNSLIENHHKVIKNDLLKNVVNMKPGRAIKELRGDVLSQLVKIRCNNAYKPRPNKKVKVEDPIEEFKPPKAPQVSNFEKADKIRKQYIKTKLFCLPEMEPILLFLENFEIQYRDKPFIKTVGNLTITKRDLSTFDNENWLNDTAIFTYLSFIAPKSFLILDSYFFEK